MKKLISIIGSAFLVAPLSITVVSCGSKSLKRDLDSVVTKDLGEIKGVEDIPTLETIVKSYEKKTGDHFLSQYHVRFVGTPTKTQATIEPNEKGVQLTGSVTFNYDYKLIQPIIWSSQSKVNLEVRESDTIFVDIDNSYGTAKLETTVEDERDKKMIEVTSIEKLEVNNDIDKYKSSYKINYKVNDYIAKDLEKEQENIKVIMSLKYKEVTKDTEIVVHRINLESDKLNPIITRNWDINNMATEEEIINAWNLKNPKYQLSVKKDVEVIRKKEQGRFVYRLKARINATTWYRGSVNLLWGG
ncbi:lipoprotein [Spiroplasma apis]|uniref:Lipoprotein n=1 Tax=Spiroplasma apis B31 TaxID=1276258 RepID=V5RIZ0_SPIAP|nr:lipoprotein [Spiroplasma apis]AHB36453.1 hypothetical protein SAPIS_v1c06080 [Spiroplasma apis B31]